MTSRIENRATHSLQKYLQEIGQVSLLTPKEEIKLTRRIKQGDQQALSELIEANLRFVVSVAMQYQNKGLCLGDLINEGNLGLIRAAQHFDETLGFKLISYAVWWIRQAILQAIAEQTRIVHLPLNRVSTLLKIGKAYQKLEQEFERKPSTSEIAEQLEMSEGEIGDHLYLAGHYLSIDAPFGISGEGSLLAIIENEHQPAPDSDLLDESLKIEIESVLTTLTKREAEILRLYFGLGEKSPLTLEEIGERLNLTRERIRQIKETALERLRHMSRSMFLRKYLG
jgi:RNA polymerase primary sigma factor